MSNIKLSIENKKNYIIIIHCSIMTKINYPLLSKTIESDLITRKEMRMLQKQQKKLCIDFHFLIFFFSFPSAFFVFSFHFISHSPSISHNYIFFVQYTATFRSSFRLILQWQEDILNHKQMEKDRRVKAQRRSCKNFQSNRDIKNGRQLGKDIEKIVLINAAVMNIKRITSC